MTQLRRLAAAVIFIGLFSVDSRACSLLSIVGETDGSILIVGKISGHITEEFNGQEIFGVSIKPIQEYGAEDIRQTSDYRFFPAGLGADCSRNYLSAGSRFAAGYDVGSVAAVIAHDMGDEVPGGYMLDVFEGLTVLPEHCTADDVINYQYTGQLGPYKCGLYFFYVYKAIALLRDADEKTTLDILTHLSHWHGMMRYTDLVDNYVTSVENRKMLLRLRYGDLVDRGCSRETGVATSDDDREAERRERWRWNEYCRFSRRTGSKVGEADDSD